MAYRFSASGTIEVAPRNLDRVCSILNRQQIRYEVVSEGCVKIDHNERAATLSHHRPEEPFQALAPYVDRPQSLKVYSELLGENEVGFLDGKVLVDTTEKVWASEGEPPSPDALVEGLRERGISSRVSYLHGSRKSGRRSRIFDIQPASGGPACRMTIKKRFWDSYDLLSVPDVSQPLCRKYHLTPEQLRERLHGAKFGVEVRNPALGSPSSAMLYENLLELVEEHTEGIRTELG